MREVLQNKNYCLFFLKNIYLFTNNYFLSSKQSSLDIRHLFQLCFLRPPDIRLLVWSMEHFQRCDLHLLNRGKQSLQLLKYYLFILFLILLLLLDLHSTLLAISLCASMQHLTSLGIHLS